MRLNLVARKRGSAGNRAQRGRCRALSGSCQKVQDVASLQSLPAPFGPPLGCLAFLPKSPVYKLTDSGRRLELERATPSHGLELGKSQSQEAETRASRLAASVLHPGHLRSSPPTLAHPALRWLQSNSAKRNPRSLVGSHPSRYTACPLGARVPQLQGLSTAPSVGRLDPDTGPQTKARAPLPTSPPPIPGYGGPSLGQ